MKNYLVLFFYAFISICSTVYAGGGSIAGGGGVLANITDVLKNQRPIDGVYTVPDTMLVDMMGYLNANPELKKKFNITAEGLVVNEGIPVLSAYDYTKKTDIFFISDRQKKTITDWSGFVEGLQENNALQNYLKP